MPEWTPWLIYGLAALMMLAVVVAEILVGGGAG